jgi:hypothetical protein
MSRGERWRALAGDVVLRFQPTHAVTCDALCIKLLNCRRALAEARVDDE